MTPTGGVSYVGTPSPKEEDTDDDADYYLLAKSYFDCKEYRRAAHVLRSQTSKKSVYLRCYALYLVTFWLVILLGFPMVLRFYYDSILS